MHHRLIRAILFLCEGVITIIFPMRASMLSLSERGWQRIKRFLFAEHRAVLAFFIVVLFVSLLFPYIASAQILTDIGNQVIGGFSTVFLAIARFFLSLTLYALDFFLNLAAYNAFIDAPPVVVGWFMVRDLANMFFIVALLVIAFSTMLGLENYAWKKSLVKLIAAAILVNFSRLILGFLIDASQVVTLTFLNAVEGAAGGNLINMLQLNKILEISTGAGRTGADSLQVEILAGSIAAVVFSSMALFTIAAYAVLMLIRVLILWMLIILSPLAFVLSAIPQTKGYSSEFWGELSKYLIVGPLMTFFLWLAFATLGNGQISASLGVSGVSPVAEEQQVTSAVVGNEGASVTVNAISRWENLSSFFIAVGFLLLGIERVQKIGVRGTDIANSILSTGKKVTRSALKLGAVAGFGASGAGIAAAGAGALGYKGYKVGKFQYESLAERAKQGYYNTVGRGDLIREGKLAEEKNTTKAIQARWIAKGSEIAPAGDRLAQAIIAKSAAEKLANESQKISEAKIKKTQLDREVSARDKAIADENKRLGREMNKVERGEFVDKYVRNSGDSSMFLKGMALEQEAATEQKKIKEDAQKERMIAFNTERAGGIATNLNLKEAEDFKKTLTSFAGVSPTQRKQWRDEAFDNIRQAEVDIQNAKNDESRIAAEGRRDKAVKDMYGLVTSSLEQKEGGLLVDQVRQLVKDGKLDKSFAKIDDSAEDIPQLMLALHGKLGKYTSKEDRDNMDSDALRDFRTKTLGNAQEAFEKSMGGGAAAATAMRNLKVAMDINGSEAGAEQWKGQIGQRPGGGIGFTQTLGADGSLEQRKVEAAARQGQTLRSVRKIGNLFRTEMRQDADGNYQTQIVDFLNDFSSDLANELKSGSVAGIDKAVLAEFGRAKSGPVFKKTQEIIQARLKQINEAKSGNDYDKRMEELVDLVRAFDESPGLSMEDVKKRFPGKVNPRPRDTKPNTGQGRGKPPSGTREIEFSDEE